VVRALEIYHSGTKKSDIKDDFTPIFDYDCYSYDYPRDVLYQRINKRVDLMIEKGLIDEVKRLLDSGISKTSQSMQGIGYKEIVSYLDGEINLNDAIELIKLNTRHYAKRQITFFKKVPKINYILPKDNARDIAKIITKDLL
jgi:tRNA dimethylallyltransferase